MSIRPLDVAQNIGTQSQIAADKASERHAERTDKQREQQHALETAKAQLERVRESEETVGKLLRDRDPSEHPPEHPHDHPHADGSPEGKGRAVDLDA